VGDHTRKNVRSQIGEGVVMFSPVILSRTPPTGFAAATSQDIRRRDTNFEIIQPVSVGGYKERRGGYEWQWERHRSGAGSAGATV